METKKLLLRGGKAAPLLVNSPKATERRIIWQMQDIDPGLSSRLLLGFDRFGKGFCALMETILAPGKHTSLWNARNN